jgi:hypothetical protein
VTIDLLETSTAQTAGAVEIDLTPWEYSLAAQVGADRFAQNFGKQDARHYDRSRVEDDRTAQHAAAAAEIATARAFDRYWTACGAWAAERHSEYRNIPDVGRNIEVRRIREGSASTFAISPKDRERIIAVCFVEMPELRRVRVLGWVDGETALEVGTDAGYGDRVRVPISILSLRGIQG